MQYLSSVLHLYLLPVFPYLLQPPVISNTVSSHERSHIEYIRMSSPVYQYVINLGVSLPFRIVPWVLMKVSVWEHRSFKK